MSTKDDEYDAKVVNSIVKRRAGQILSKYTILKTDEIPGTVKYSLIPRISGAFNYRKRKKGDIYGVGRITVHGIKAILQLVGAKINRRDNEKARQLYWVNLREEPVLFINGRTCVLRHFDNPFKNLSEYKGILGGNVDKMEQQLKMDVLAEATQFKGLILLHDEVDVGVMVPCWEYIDENAVFTTKEIFELLSGSCLVNHIRIPLAPDSCPPPEALDYFVNLAQQIPESDAAIVFNCQSGRGRSTFGMAIMSLLHAHIKEYNIIDIPEDPISRPALKIITMLLRVLPDGLLCKKRVDQILEECSQVYHILNHVYNMEKEALKCEDIDKAHEKRSQAISSLERYFLLLCFCSYLGENASRFPNIEKKFSIWLAERAEIIHLLRQCRDYREPLFSSEIDKIPGQNLDIIKNRSGHILTSKTLLKLDYIQDFTPSKPAPNYYQYSNLPLYSAGQMTVDQLKAVLTQLNAGPNGSSTVSLFNIRLDTYIYISGRTYVLRNYDEAKKPLNAYVGIELSRLEAMEDRLKEDILIESEKGGNKILLHEEDSDGVINPIIKEISNNEVNTSKEIPEVLSSKGYRIKYSRVPLILSHVDYNVIEILSSQLLNAKGNIIFFNSASGQWRSVIGAIITILLLHRDHYKDQLVKRVPRFFVIKKLIQVLPKGQEATHLVDSIIDNNHFEADNNIRDRIIQYYEKSKKAASDAERNHSIHVAKSCLGVYFRLIVFAAFLLENRPLEQFKQWRLERSELRNLLDEINHVGGQESFYYTIQDTGVVSDYEKVIRVRDGTMLQSNTILKSDHFPGCHKKHIPVLEGAPNFRQVEGNLPIYGVGIPTKKGLTQILSNLKEKYSKIIWICLREEPLVYVNGSPYVLRDSAHPFRNPEYTGISGLNVEEMELRLKEDIIKEAAKYEGKILLVDEEVVQYDDSSEIIKTNVINIWQKVDSVKTTREMYESCGKEVGASVVYHRIPVTDEKVFEEQDFDDICAIAKDIFQPNSEPSGMIFNCQMGQGRTTTGMTVGTVMWQLKDKDVFKLTPSKQSALSNTEFVEAVVGGNLKNSDGQNLMKNTYLKGEYRSILHLVRALSGANSKRQLDEAIDRCSIIQNLREAIYTFVQKAETEPHIYQKALDFLERYFYLITFTHYVSEQLSKPQEMQFKEKFTEWMKTRTEIYNILENLSLE